jgi:hypothetical protein
MTTVDKSSPTIHSCGLKTYKERDSRDIYYQVNEGKPKHKLLIKELEIKRKIGLVMIVGFSLITCLVVKFIRSLAF